MGRAISSKGVGQIIFEDRSHQSVAVTYRTVDEFARSGKNCICFESQQNSEEYEYEFKGKDARCDEDSLPPCLLVHVRTVFTIRNYRELDNCNKRKNTRQRDKSDVCESGG